MARGQNAVAGFFSGFTGSYSGDSFNDIWQRTTAAALSGGVSSEIAGEGFENGAVTAATVALFSSGYSIKESEKKGGLVGGVANFVKGIWELPTNILGKVIGGLSDVFGAEKYLVTFEYEGKEYTKTVHVGGVWNIGSGRWGTSIGNDIMIGEATLGGLTFDQAIKFTNFRHFISHELGHTIQASILGPFYIPLVAPFTGWSYGHRPFSWAEDWADKLIPQIRITYP